MFIRSFNSYLLPTFGMSFDTGGDGGSLAGGGGSAGSGGGDGGAGSTGAGGAGEGQTWRDSLPEDIRGAKALEKYQDIAGLAKGYVSLASKIGQNPIIKPGEGAAQEELDNFYNALGRPDAPEKYAFDKEKLPQGFAAPDKVLPEVQKIFHKHGLTEAQAKGVFEDYSALLGGVVNDANQEMKMKAGEFVEQLKKDFGTAFDQKVAQAQKAVNKYGTEELKTLFNETGSGNHPEVVKFLAKIGEALGGDTLPTDGGNINPEGAMTPAEAKEAISEMEKDPEFRKAFMDKRHPKHQEMKDKRSRLFKLAFPEQN